MNTYKNVKTEAVFHTEGNCFGKNWELVEENKKKEKEKKEKKDE